LLYQADPRNKGTVIALRPQTEDPLPCVLTLDQSPLVEAKYEVITHEPEHSAQPASIALAEMRQFPDGKSSNMSRLFHSKPSVELPQEQSSTVQRMGPSASHSTPLMVNISPEGNPKSLANEGNTSSSSLLMARRDNNYYFSSHSSVFSSSRRKKTARKSVFPRKVSPSSSPSHSLTRKSVHGMHFQRELARHSANLAPRRDNQAGFGITSESARCEGNVDSPGLCDSTENGNHRNPMDETEEMDVAPHHGENCGSGNATAACSGEDSAGFSNFPMLESSSTNGSSPAISEDHPLIVDIHSDSREASGGENDSDSNAVSSENSPTHSHPTMAQKSHGNRSESLHEAEEQAQCLHASTPIVVLQNTVQVKTEPNEVLQSPSNLSPEQNNKDTNLPHADDDSEHRSTLHRVPAESYSVVMPTSSQDSHSSSLLVHQVQASMPHIVNVMGASPDHNEHTDSSHHHPNNHYMDGKEYSCDVCHKQFDSANSVMRHKRSHSGDRPYICKICGWGFNLSGNLNQHLAIHQKVKPFKCVYCGKTFARSNVLKAHVRCHTGERPYQCQLCGSKFIIGHNLKKHMLTRHGIKEDDKIFSQNDGPDGDGPPHSDQSERMSTPTSQS